MMGTPPPQPLRRRRELLNRPPNHNLDIVIRPHEPSWLARFWRNFLNGWRLFSFHLRPGPYIEDMAKRLETSTTGKRDSHVPLLSMGGYTALEWINAQRAIYGYEPLPEEPQPEYEGMQFAQADWTPER